MQLAGDANWWAPGWMRRLHDRFGFTEHTPPSDTVDLSSTASEDTEPADDPVPV